MGYLIKATVYCVILQALYTACFTTTCSIQLLALFLSNDKSWQQHVFKVLRTLTGSWIGIRSIIYLDYTAYMFHIALYSAETACRTRWEFPIYLALYIEENLVR